MTLDDYYDGQKFIILDTETTGLDPQKEKICSLYAIKLQLDRIDDKFLFRHIENYGFHCDPEHNIANEATKVNGFFRDETFNIEDKNNLFGLPTIQNYVHPLIEFIDNSIIISHNINFDMGFILNEIQNSGLLKANYLKDIIPGVICTKQTFAGLLNLPKTFEYIKNTSLDKLCDFLAINTDIRQSGHNAFVDTQLTTECFKVLATKYPKEIDVLSICDLPEFKKIIETINTKQINSYMI